MKYQKGQVVKIKQRAKALYLIYEEKEGYLIMRVKNQPGFPILGSKKAYRIQDSDITEICGERVDIKEMGEEEIKNEFSRAYQQKNTSKRRIQEEQKNALYLNSLNNLKKVVERCGENPIADGLQCPNCGKYEVYKDRNDPENTEKWYFMIRAFRVDDYSECCNCRTWFN